MTHPNADPNVGATAPSLRAEFKTTWRLAAPVIVIQLGMMAMGTVDVAMVGHVSKDALAAVALGHLYTWAVLSFGFGIVLAVDPIVSQAVGANDATAARLGVQRGAILAVLLTLPLSLCMLPAEWVLAALGQQPTVVPAAGAYIRTSIPGVFPFLGFMLLRLTLQAQSRTIATVVTIAIANVVNALLNWALIFGNLGFEPMGVVGAAWATSISRWAMLLILLVVGRRELMPLLWPLHRRVFDVDALWRMLRLGLPIALQFELEMGAFALTALLMGRFGEVELGGHQIALSLASLPFMVPLGISQAGSVRVGYAVGGSDVAAARRAATVALFSGVGVMTIFAVVFVVLPSTLASLYTTDLAVLAMAATLVPLAGIFQVFDGIQVVAIGILRGLGDTKTPFVVNLIGFWAIGVPAGALLTYSLGFGPIGLWWGLVIGLAAVATFLAMRIPGALRRGVARLALDATHGPSDHRADARVLPESVDSRSDTRRRDPPRSSESP
jgi:MATE family multidrug resistance protein